ncbi:unnamed protein product [marine sediment metagenome]|uniref:Response regulatory domain-containing protein n=1 Tax=marine sediment metagenome TaxID=412755 RepID=X1L431_9ZZZZ
MNRHRILVVDSESDFIKTVREALNSSYKVSAASTRKEGLDKAKRETPHMVILGYLEPRGDAFKLHKELRETLVTKNIPLLVVDVNPQEHARKGWSREQGMQMKAEDYISRPVEPAELAELVGGILEIAAPKSMELRDALEQMERVLKRVDKIEKMLTK